MNRTLRQITSYVLGPLALGAALFASLSAEAAPPPPAGGETSLESKLGRLLGRPGGLTAEMVAVRAEATSFDVAARRQELQAAAAGVDQAFVGYFPKLNLSGRYTRLSPIDQPPLGNLIVAPGVAPGPVPAGTQLQSVPFAFPVFLNQVILQATLNVPLSDYLLRIPQAHAAATRSERAAALTEQATRKKVASDAKVAYYTWVRARLQEVVTEQALVQSNAHLSDVKHAFDVGTTSRADVLRIESQVAQAQLLLERTTNMRSVAEAQIRVAMHDNDLVVYEVGESVDAEVKVANPGDDLTAMWSEAKASRLEVRALEESSGSFREQAKVARAGSWPRLDGFGGVMYANPNPRIVPATDSFRATWEAGVSLTWSPNDIGTSVASGTSLEARAASIISQRQALEDGIRLEVTQARNALREAQAAIESTARGLTAAEESYRVRRSLFQNGRATSVELTDAETDLTRSRLESINSRVDLKVAQVRLEHALGRDTLAANGGDPRSR